MATVAAWNQVRLSSRDSQKSFGCWVSSKGGPEVLAYLKYLTEKYFATLIEDVNNMGFSCSHSPPFPISDCHWVLPGRTEPLIVAYRAAGN